MYLWGLLASPPGKSQNCESLIHGIGQMMRQYRIGLSYSHMLMLLYFHSIISWHYYNIILLYYCISTLGACGSVDCLFQGSGDPRHARIAADGFPCSLIGVHGLWEPLRFNKGLLEPKTSQLEFIRPLLPKTGPLRLINEEFCNGLHK